MFFKAIPFATLHVGLPTADQISTPKPKNLSTALHSQIKVAVHYLYYYSMNFPSAITFYNTAKKNRQAKRTVSTVSTTYVACIYINSHRQKLQAVHNSSSSRTPLKCLLLDNCYKKICNSTVLHPIRWDLHQNVAHSSHEAAMWRLWPHLCSNYTGSTE